MTIENKRKLEEVEEIAKALFAMVDRVKGSSESTKVTYPVYQADERGKPKKVGEETVELKQPARDWTAVGKQKDTVAAVDPDMTDEELKSLVESGSFEQDQINLADIPF